jgi:hypothetical protein
MTDLNAISGTIDSVQITGKTVVVKRDYFASPWKDGDRRFKAEDGFGCSPVTIGRAVFGHFADGEKDCISRDDIEGLAVEAL